VLRDTGASAESRESLDPDLLRRTAMMFRTFGEDYHETKLEEQRMRVGANALNRCAIGGGMGELLRAR